jgi:hypothetical protein
MIQNSDAKWTYHWAAMDRRGALAAGGTPHAGLVQGIHGASPQPQRTGAALHDDGTGMRCRAMVATPGDASSRVEEARGRRAWGEPCCRTVEGAGLGSRRWYPASSELGGR